MPIKKLKKHLDTQYRGWVIFALVLIGVISLATRFNLSTGEGVPASDKVYILSYDADFEAEDTDAIIRLSPPWDTKNSLVISQKIETYGLRLLRNSPNNESTRDIVAVATSPGSKRLIAEFTVHLSPLGHKRPPLKKVVLSAEQRERYLSGSDELDIDSIEVARLIKELAVHEEDKVSLIENIFKYLNKNIILAKTPTDDVASSALRTHKASTLGRARAMVALCRAGKIPSRLVTGFILKEGFEVEEHYWVEAYDEEKWVPYDPENGYYETLPPDFLPVRRGGTSSIGDSNLTYINVSYDISEQYVPVGKLGRETKGITDILDLTRLSLDARDSLAILLLLPLGALFTTFCSSVIGIRTYGTFTPTLLALAARYADLITATVIFSVVAVTGLLGRSFMPDELSRIPRLTIVFTVAAMGMTLGVSLMDYYSINPAGHVLLLPIIILTSLVDRLYKALDEDGVRIATIRLGWTAVVGVGCYFILIQERLGHFILSYPEIHLFTVALVLSLSAYKYKKLSDVSFLKWITEPKKTKPSKSKKSTDIDPAQDAENI